MNEVAVVNELSDWMTRHGNDKYYRMARNNGHVSRAYYKIEEIDRKYRVFKPGGVVLDLGSAPGGWISYESKVVRERGKILAVDLQDLRMRIDPNVQFIRADFETLSREYLKRLFCRPVDVVASDLAPRFSGISSLDMARHYSLVSKVLETSLYLLDTSGILIIKLFQGEFFDEYVKRLKTLFREVKLEKPRSSRGTSREVYAVCRNSAYTGLDRRA